MKSLFKTFVFISILIAFSGCKKFGGSKASMSSYEASPAMAPMAERMMEVKPVPTSDSASPSPTQIGQIDRKIIYTAEIRIEVKKYEDGLEAIKKLAQDSGGYIADTHVDVDASDVKSGEIIIKVPSQKFHEVLSGVKGIGNVKYEAEHGSDVTEEYFDLELRLNNSKKMETRLLDLLEKQTKSVKDLLEVEKELGRVREDIERMEGRKRFLDDRLSFSTITVTLYEPHAYTSSVFDPLKDTWSNMWGNLISSFAAVVSFVFAAVPWIILIGFFLWLGIKLVRRWLKKRKQAE